MRKLIWLIVVLGWLTAIVVALIKADNPAPVAGAMVVCAIASWIVTGITLSWAFGIRRHLFRHFGGRIKDAQTIRYAVRSNERVNIQRALDHFHRELNRRNTLFGFKGFYAGEYGNFGGSDFDTIIKSNGEPASLQWDTFQASYEETQECARNAIYLLKSNGKPFAVIVRHNESESPLHVELEVLGSSRESAKAGLDSLLQHAATHSIYRGAVISLERPDNRRDQFVIKFHRLDTPPRDQIILPKEVMRVVERNTLGMLEHSETLKRTGRSTRHGVLFHGPPGTGKTLVTKHLASRCEKYTVFLLTGWQLSLIRDSFHLARMLAPSLVILEDVDLIATARRRNRNKTVLHDLMDEMDGLTQKTECIVLMTTNRPDVLEPALAARPGRVDQAIYFPMPDDECRKRLFDLFATDLDLAAADVGDWVRKTDGASPAFIEELFRKAVLMAAERGATDHPLKLINEDIERAMRELVFFGGELTRNLLGFPRDDRVTERNDD